MGEKQTAARLFKQRSSQHELEEEHHSKLSLKDLDVPVALLANAKGPSARDFLEYVQVRAESSFWCKTTRLLMLPAFDYAMATLILSNMVIMIFEIDQAAKADEDDNATVGTLMWAEVCGNVVLVIFVFELALRLFVFRSFFWREKWNVFDFIVVSLDATVLLMSYFVGALFPVSILRVFRLVKLARATKVLRLFPELRLLLAGLIGSISAIFWGTVLLFLTLLVWAMIAVIFINPLCKKIDFGDCGRCYYAFSSVMHSTLTFWQTIVAGDAWGEITVPIIEDTPLSIVFFLPMFLMTGMAVMNLLLGVVVAVAMQSKDDLQEEDTLEIRLQKLEQQSHILDLCADMDPKCTGELSHAAVWKAFRAEGDFRDSLQALDITEDDLHIIWTIADPEKSGKVTYRDLMSRLYSIRTSDTEFMLAHIKYHITEIRNALMERIDMTRAEVQRELQVIQKIEETVDVEEQEIQQLVEQTLPSSQTVGVWEPLHDTEKDRKVCSGVADDSEVEAHKSVAVPTALPALPTGLQNDGTLKPSNPRSLNAASKSLDDTTVETFNVFWQELATLQAELKDMLRGMSGILESQASLVSSKQDAIVAMLARMTGGGDLVIV